MTAAKSTPPLVLAVTCRCLTDDLDFSIGDCKRPLSELAHSGAVAAFVEKRSQSPEGQETIQELQPRLTAYSLHIGRYRGATWHDRGSDICWLLAVGIHRADNRDDAYSYFSQLLSTNRLLPTTQDVIRALENRRPSFELLLTEDIPALRRKAITSPGQVHEAILGNRIRVRVIYENGETGLLTVAISSDLVPQGPAVPGNWYPSILAAFLPDSEGLDMAFDLGGEALRSEENGFCGLVIRDE